MAKDNQIHVLLTDRQRKALDKRVAETGASISEIMRRALDKALGLERS